ncbi:acyl-CoA thioesterase II [Rhodoluna sp. KAS3]|uniref:acyl-CoA thioesterase n=1 Tax=Rhodoluna sp. KAS3 TaxID=942880 RepID=UPI002232B21F|nr:acyl-CoA thioesterase II [Rhodoluna sp. KAS3]BDS49207.1 acyl-CoA thioesterase II [Rhodoluna sp. KAS3]
MNTTIPNNPLEEMIATLNLSDANGAKTREDIFTGPSQWMPHGRVFGGQVLAQSLVAATRTVENRFVHSLHGYFLRPGDINLPITFSVDRLRDGRSFSTRRVQAYQKGEPIFSMIASFQVTDPGLEHQDAFPAGIPDPETLPSAAELIGENPHPVAQYWAKARPFDMRHVGSPIYFSVQGEQVPHQAVWLKALGTMPDDLTLHTAALAYASDYSILESIYRAHGIAWSHPGLKSASLDHAMWFHRQAKVDGWMLYVQESPSAQGGRGLAMGKIFSRDGQLLATVAQEGMVRVPEMAD